MKRSEVLDTAKEYTNIDRNADYGEPEDNFAHIAEYWTSYKGVEFTAMDVGVMMALMKIARLRTSPKKADNYVDGAAYLACAAECAGAE